MRFFTVLLLITSIVLAQESNECPCCTDAHKQFHFWIGEWNAYDTTGILLGTNKIVIDQDKCLMIENWKSANSSFTGTSYNYYDRTDESWNQTWVDNQGSNLMLKGKFTDGKIILRSKLKENSNGVMFYHQITWTPNVDGTVTQRWDMFNDQDVFLSTAFLGIYRRTN